MIGCGVDIESTGLDWTKGHRIIEIAIIVYNLTTQAEMGRYVQRINPERPIDPKAQEVHGISFDDVAHCPTWDEVGPKVSKLLSRIPVAVAHNGEGFDIPFINSELARIGQPVFAGQLVDTLLQGRWATPNGKIPNLGELCFACGVDYDPTAAHAADYDVERMMACYFAVAPKGFFTIPAPKLKEAA